MVIVRKLASAVTALGVGLAVAVAGIVPANAAGLDASGPITVLPSAVAAGSGYTSSGGGNSGQAMAMLYKSAVSPETAVVLRDRQNGVVLTPQQTTIVQRQQSIPVKYPTGSATTFTKTSNGLGGAASIFSNFQFGSTIGAIAGQPLLEMFGIDANSTVCGAAAAASGAGAAALGFFSGQECAPYEIPAEFQKNLDAVASPPGWMGYPVGVSASSSTASGWYGYFTVSPQPQAVVSQTLTFTNAERGAQEDVQVGAVCKSGSKYRAVEGSPRLNFNSRGSGFSSSTTIDCPTDSVLYGLVFNTQVWSDSALASKTPEELAQDYIRFSGADRAQRFWWSGASPLAPPAVSADPERKLECVIATTTGATFSALSKPFTEGAGALPDVVCPELPPGVIADTMTVNEVDTKGSHKLWDVKVPAEVTNALQKYPECASSVCMVELTKLGSQPLTTCHQDPTGCADWFTDPNKLQKYGCTFGGKAVSMDECTPYAQRWNPERQAQGQYLSDPKTGAATQPPPGAVTSPDKGSMSSPVQDPTKARECFPSGWGVVNPLNWVLQPAKCALEWAFVPRPEAQKAALDRMSKSTQGSALGSVGRLVSAVTTVTVPTAGSCQGPPLAINMPAWGVQKTSYPFSACAEPMAGVASTVKTLGAGVILLVSTMAVTRYLAGIIGFTAFGIASAGSNDPDDATVNLRTGEIK